MIDLPTELRRAVDNRVAPVTAQEVRGRTDHANRRPQRLRAAVLAAALVVVAAVIIGVGVPRGRNSTEPRSPGASPRLHSIDGAFSIRIPSGWHSSEKPLAPWLADPHEMLSVATAPIAPIDAPGNQAACPSEIPKAGVNAIGRNGIYVWIGGASKAFNSTPIPRPTSFASAPWHGLCALGNGSHTEGLTFEEFGRSIVISVVVGATASDRQQSDLYAMLDSMEVQRVPGADSGACRSEAKCIAGNETIVSIPNLSSGSINAARTFGVVPGSRGLLTLGTATPIGDLHRIRRQLSSLAVWRGLATGAE